MRLAFKWLFGVGLLAATTGVTFGAKKLRIATEGAYPPFNFVDSSGELKGFDVDIANALCKEMKVECEIQAQAWDGIIPALLAKKFDVIVASMSITEKRKKAVAFTRKYYQVGGVFVAAKGKKLTISKEGLEGKKIGVQRAATYEGYLKATYGNVVDVKVYDTIDNHNLDLVAGRLDAVFAQHITMYKWLKTKRGKPFMIYGDPIFNKKHLGEGAGIAVRKEDKALLAKINAALQRIIDSGLHQRLNDKYFPFSLLQN